MQWRLIRNKLTLGKTEIPFQRRELFVMSVRLSQMSNIRPVCQKSYISKSLEGTEKTCEVWGQPIFQQQLPTSHVWNVSINLLDLLSLYYKPLKWKVTERQEERNKWIFIFHLIEPLGLHIFFNILVIFIRHYAPRKSIASTE